MSEGPLVLLVEDEPQMRRFLRATLTSHGFRLIEAETSKDGMMQATAHNPEIILLDLGLPDGDGIDLTREIRTWTNTPIIVISARGREADKVEALDAGADDYLTKPFGVNELMARIRVAQRRTRDTAPGETALSAGPLKVDLQKRLVTLRGEEVHLTPLEYRLVVLLLKHRGKVLTHRQILKEVWGPTYAGQTHYLRVYMAQLRRKLEPDPAQPKLVITEPGVGYRLRDLPEEPPVT